MEVTEKDRFFYSSAIESLTARFEIAREFVKYNGLTSLPMEELTELMVLGIKEWIVGKDGEQWLSTLGYVKSGNIAISGSVHINISGSVCPSCSGLFPESNGMYCERCGRYTCRACISIVDPVYQIGWCEDCLMDQPLTNLLVYNE